MSETSADQRLKDRLLAFIADFDSLDGEDRVLTALRRHPTIEETAFVTLALADEAAGQRALVVRPRPEAAMTEGDVRDYLRVRSVQAAAPASVAITMRPFPRLVDGSCDTDRLAERIAELPAENGPGRPWRERRTSATGSESIVPRKYLLGAAAAVAVVVGAWAIYLSRPTVSTPRAAGVTALVQPVADTVPSAEPTEVPVVSAPASPPIGVVLSDEFDLSDLNPLNLTNVGRPWGPSEFYSFGGTAFVGPSRTSDRPTIALVALSAPATTLRARMAVVRPGAGIVLWSDGRERHTVLEVDPASGAWTVVRIADGAVSTRVSTGLIAQDGDLITVHWADGVYEIEVNDNAGDPIERTDDQPTLIGLSARGALQNEARWESIEAEAPTA